METGKTKYPNWAKIEWDGNTELGYKCYRKSFGRGHVSVGIGEFTLICFSHGASSDNSLSGGRWWYGNTLTEGQAMQLVDLCGGYHDHKNGKGFVKTYFQAQKQAGNSLKNPGKPIY